MEPFKAIQTVVSRQIKKKRINTRKWKIIIHIYQTCNIGSRNVVVNFAERVF